MKLGLNPLVYGAAGQSIETGLQQAAKFGFAYIDYPAKGDFSPTAMTDSQRCDLVQIFNDNGLVCSQMLLIDCWQMAASDPAARQNAMEYMKQCAEFMLELGGRQMLICRGAGMHEVGRTKALGWASSVDAVRDYSQWCLDKGLLVGLEMDVSTYCVLNSLAATAQMIRDVDSPNLFANIDIGHLFVTREGPDEMEHVGDKILHLHISDNDTFGDDHNLIGTGHADFAPYIHKAVELGIAANCEKADEVPTAALEMGETGGVDDPDRWVRESLAFLSQHLPELAV